MPHKHRARIYHCHWGWSNDDRGRRDDDRDRRDESRYRHPRIDMHPDVCQYGEGKHSKLQKHTETYAP